MGSGVAPQGAECTRARDCRGAFRRKWTPVPDTPKHIMIVRMHPTLGWPGNTPGENREMCDPCQFRRARAASGIGPGCAGRPIPLINSGRALQFRPLELISFE